MNDELIFKKRQKLKGEDGYQIVSVRMHKSDLKLLDDLVKETNETRNALINIFVRYGIAHSKVINGED